MAEDKPSSTARSESEISERDVNDDGGDLNLVLLLLLLQAQDFVSQLHAAMMSVPTLVWNRIEHDLPTMSH